MKGGVYVLWKEIDNIEDPSFTIVKIGRSKNIAHRFKSANTFVYHDEHKTKIEHIVCIIHSPSNACHGTSILEGLVHNYYERYRKPRTEYFKFPGKFDVGSDHSLLEFLKSKNLTDVSIYRNILDVPDSIPTHPNEFNMPTSYPHPSTFQPRDSQLKTLEKMNTYFSSHDKGCLFMPPGMGKTYLAGFYILQNPQLKRIIIFVPQLLIATEFKTMFQNLQCQKKIITLSSQHDDIKSSHPYFPECAEFILITTYQTFSKHQPLFPSVYDFIVYDEAHHLPEACEYQKSLNIRGSKLFMTATPKIINIDHKSPNIDGIREFSLDNVELYGHVIDSMTLHSAIDQGSLCDYRLIIHQDREPSDALATTQLRDCVEPIIQLCQIYNRKRIVVFYNTRERANQSKERFHAFTQGLNTQYQSFYIDGEMTQSQKESILSEFTGTTNLTNETCHVIFNVNVLSEGVSLPCVDSVLLMDPKSSPILLTQICGRAMRTYPGKEEAVFCIPSNCVDTLNVLIQYIFYDITKTLSKRSIETEITKRLITHGTSNVDETHLKNIVHRRVKLIEISKIRGKHALFQQWAEKGILSGVSLIPDPIAKTLVQLNELTQEDIQYLKNIGRKSRLSELEQYHKARIRNVALRYYFRERYEEYSANISATLIQLSDKLHKCSICSCRITSYESFSYSYKNHCSQQCKQQGMVIQAHKLAELEQIKKEREEQKNQVINDILKNIQYEETIRKDWVNLMHEAPQKRHKPTPKPIVDKSICFY